MATGPLAAAVTLTAITIGTCCPVRVTATGPELRRLLRRLRPSAVIVQYGVPSAARAVATEMGVRVLDVAVTDEALTSAEIVGDSSRRMDPCRPSSSAHGLILQTSGTTGFGKLVPVTWPTMYAAARATVRAYALTESDRRLNVTQLTHIQGTVGSLLAAFVSGGSIIVASAFEPSTVPSTIAAQAVTWFSASPAQHFQILGSARAQRISTLRFVRVGSSALKQSLRAQLEEFYRVPVVESYGMTEAHQIASTPLPPAASRQGLVPTGSDVAIRTSAGSVHREPGQRGELVVRGTNVMTGYMAPTPDEGSRFADGWFRTGDEGEFLEDGSFRITGRLNELINRGGTMISPVEIEEALLTHPDVADAGAFGLPHAELGEALGLAVVLEHGASLTPAAIRDFLSRLVASHKLPDRVVFRDRLPLTAGGKLSRAALARTPGASGSQ